MNAILRRKGNEWVYVSTTKTLEDAIEMARKVLFAIYVDGYVDKEDKDWYDEEFERQVNAGNGIWIDDLIKIEEWE